MTTSTHTNVIDVDEETFQSEVVDRSREIPVVVDFWAPWCGPCRVLGPILERLAQDNDGGFLLAKLNVDENPNLAAQFGVQGIPLVKAFKDGRVADEFVGAQPQPVVRQFIERLLPNETDIQIGEARQLLAAGKPVEAEGVFRQVLEAQPAHPAATLGLAQVLMAQKQDGAAAEMLARVPLGTPEGTTAAQLLQELHLRAEAGDSDENALRQRLAEAPGDLEARYKLASLLAVQKRYEEALDNYLEIVRRNRSFREGAARQAMLHIFDQLGDDPLARRYRNQLASALFV